MKIIIRQKLWLNNPWYQIRKIQGATLIEILITITVFGILTAIAAPNVTKFGTKPLPDTSNQITGQFRAARAKAIAQTAQIRIRPNGGTISNSGVFSGGSNNQMMVERSVSTYTACNAPPTSTGWVQDFTFTPEDLTFGQNITVSRAQVNPTNSSQGDVGATTWALCFDNRGGADKNLIITLRDSSDNKTQRFEVFPGGTIQLYEN